MYFNYKSVLLQVYKCTVCRHGYQKGQKRELDLLELELQVIVSHTVGAKNQTQVPLQKHQMLFNC